MRGEGSEGLLTALSICSVSIVQCRAEGREREGGRDSRYQLIEPLALSLSVEAKDKAKFAWAVLPANEDHTPFLSRDPLGLAGRHVIWRGDHMTPLFGAEV